MILDTNALSAWADGNPACRSAFAEAARLVVPAIVLGEYQYGIRQSRHRKRYEEWLVQNLPFAEVQPVSDTKGDLARMLPRRRPRVPAAGPGALTGNLPETARTKFRCRDFFP
jgi:predicted nucleic acid-binding protein